MCIHTVKIPQLFGHRTFMASMVVVLFAIVLFVLLPHRS
ncbi:MAG: membrane-bound metal-dependent hydrolase YbcI (DUF457 family), partial [Oceanicoccus sp.]